MTTAVETELARRARLMPGTLVYYDTVRGDRVPCKVTGRQKGLYGAVYLTLQVTGARWSYPKGFRFSTHAGPFVQEREAIR